MKPQFLTTDLCVIGAGSGGLSVAAAAAAFGSDVILVEKGKMGGDCLNYGCVPSKALIAASKKAYEGVNAEKFGVIFEKPKIDYTKVQAHISEIIAQIAPHDSVERFEGLGVKVIKGEGRFIDKNTLEVNETKITARRFIIATGSSPAIPPINGLDRVNYFTNETIFELTKLPKHLIIIGGGIIGVELAQAYSRLGAKVSIVEKFSVLENQDEELSSIIINALKKEGVKIYQQAEIKKISNEKQQINLEFEFEGITKNIKGSELLIATGRKSNIKNLGLEKANVEFNKAGIITDPSLKTSNKKIFAIGDVRGDMQSTHSAGYQASLVIRNALFGLPTKLNKNIIPSVIYSDPEIANVGLSEQMARDTYGGKIKIIRSDFIDNDRAKAMRQTTGFVKLILSKNGKIIGCSIIGQNAGELISLFSFAIANKQKAVNLASFISPYPTYSEIAKRVGINSFADKLSNKWIKRWISLIKLFP
ncbi:MAG: FAD-dependent oxidoreductase [Devosiaceae bacterium]|nr:FAD-dependent oxidoreductase [Devosiaceae bacterium]